MIADEIRAVKSSKGESSPGQHLKLPDIRK
jgi:hypothetical protein